MLAPCPKCSEIIDQQPGEFDCPVCGFPSFVIAPQPGPQTQFLQTAGVDIVGYGGAAGGGKSFGLLLECLRHSDNPRFGAVIFRRTCPQITNEGGLWDESRELYSHIAGAISRAGDMMWEFASGARVRFHHLQHEDSVYDHQGSQIALLAFDEATHFTEFQFRYMLSRNRSVCGVTPYVRMTFNPDAGSWVKVLFAPWVDKAFPNPAEPGDVRWVTWVNGAVTWVDPDKPVLGGDTPKSITFISSRVYDNQILTDADPGYLANLMSLPPVERRRLLDGDWDILTDRFFEMWQSRRADGSPWHVAPVTSVALNNKFYLGIDYGYAAPWSAHLVGFDYDGRCTVWRECYGEGKLASEQITDLVAMLRANGVPEGVTAYTGHDCFAAQRGAQGRMEPIVDIYRRTCKEMGYKISFVESGRDPVTRASRWREYLSGVSPCEGWPDGRPDIQIDASCKDLIRTLPLLTNDKHKPEQVDTTQEDHAFDDVGNVLTSRPRAATRPVTTVPFNPRDVFALDKAAAQKPKYDEFGLPI
jgi:hypothetical protein